LNDQRWIYGQLVYAQVWIFTQSGTPESSHLLHFLALKGQFPINNYFALGIEASVHMRHSYYLFENDVTRTSPILRLFFVTKL